MLIIIRKIIFTLSCVLSIFAITSIIHAIFGEKEAGIGAIIFLLGVSLMPMALYDIYKDNWSTHNNILIKKVFWLGCILTTMGVMAIYSVIHAYFTIDNLEFYHPDGNPKSRWLGYVYQLMADNIGAWLPIIINLGFGIFLLILGISFIISRIKINTT